MNPEVKQQLYGGEISDYYQTKKTTTPEQDNVNIGNIYQQINQKKITQPRQLSTLPAAIASKIQII